VSDDTTIDFGLGVTRRLYGCWLTGRRINSVSEGAALAFVHLMLVADDFGRFHADAGMIRNLAFFRRKVTPAKITKWIDELESAGLISVYTAGDDRYLQISGVQVNGEHRDWTVLQPTRNGRKFQKYPAPPGRHAPNTTQTGESWGIRGNPKQPNESSACISPGPKPRPRSPVPRPEPSPGTEAGDHRLHPSPANGRAFGASDGAGIHATNGAAGPGPRRGFVGEREAAERSLLRSFLTRLRFDLPEGAKGKGFIPPKAVENLLGDSRATLQRAWLAWKRVHGGVADPAAYVIDGATKAWEMSSDERAAWERYYADNVRPILEIETKAKAAKAAGGGA
jgi:hypothetical protein